MRATLKHEVAGVVKGKDMKVGQVMQCTDSSYSGALILRTYSGFVNLKNPAQTWDSPDTNMLTGVLLNSGTEIILTVD